MRQEEIDLSVNEIVAEAIKQRSDLKNEISKLRFVIEYYSVNTKEAETLFEQMDITSLGFGSQSEINLKILGKKAFVTLIITLAVSGTLVRSKSPEIGNLSNNEGPVIVGENNKIYIINDEDRSSSQDDHESTPSQPLSSDLNPDLYTIYFDESSSHIPSNEESKVDSLAKLLDDHPNLCIEVRGYTNRNIGNGDMSHENLSIARADSLRDALVSRDIIYSRIKVHGAGHNRPIYSNDLENEAFSRRVEIRFCNCD
ncbi:MAG: OmpA family protein [Thermosynechococcaceae cyanobacterium]